MTDYNGEQLTEVVALTTNPSYLSLYPTDSKNPPPVGVGETYNPAIIGERGWMTIANAEIARDAGDILILKEVTPKQVSDAMADPFINHPVSLGDGWQRIGLRAFEYNAGLVQYPSLDFGNIIATNQYNIIGDCTVLTGTTPKLTQRLGYSVSPNLFELIATGAFDETGVAGDEVSTLRFIVDDNTRVSRAVIEDIEITNLGVLSTIFSLTAGVNGTNGAYISGVVGSLSPLTFLDNTITYMGSFGPNWGRIDMSKAGGYENIYVIWEGFIGEHKLIWDDVDRYHGTIAQGANPINFQTYMQSVVGQPISVTIKLTPGG